MTYEEKSGIVISQLRADRDRLQGAVDKIKNEINKALSAEIISDNKQQISDVGIGLEMALSIIDKYTKECGDKGCI